MLPWKPDEVDVDDDNYDDCVQHVDDNDNDDGDQHVDDNDHDDGDDVGGIPDICHFFYTGKIFGE